MRIFLCLLLVALIICESSDKNNEIILKVSDFINEIFDTLINIFINCNLDTECCNSQIREYFQTFDYSENMEWVRFYYSHECYDFCYEKISKEIDLEWTKRFCKTNCPLD